MVKGKGMESGMTTCKSGGFSLMAFHAYEDADAAVPLIQIFGR